MEVKNTISILCKLLNSLYNTAIKPEHFRLAKFNKTEGHVVTTLWNTLAKILNVNHRHEIYSKLQKLNYNRPNFYALQSQGSGGSRELLIALIFFISFSLQSDLEKKLNLITHSLSIEAQGGTISEPQKAFNWQILHHHELKNFKLWLCGKTALNHKMSEQYEEQISLIQDKYNKILNVKAHSKLTVYEILALKNYEIGRQFLTETDRLLALMSIYKEWLKNERIFWKWVVTVVEETKKMSIA